MCPTSIVRILLLVYDAFLVDAILPTLKKNHFWSDSDFWILLGQMVHGAIAMSVGLLLDPPY